MEYYTRKMKKQDTQSKWFEKLENSVKQKNSYTNDYIDGITNYVEFKNKTKLHYEDIYLDDKTIIKEKS